MWRRRLAPLAGPAFFVSGLLGVLFGAGAYTVHTAEGFSYLSDDPKACVNCHIMREAYDGWRHGSHHAVATCNDCHTPTGFFAKYWTKAENGWWHSKGFTLNDFHEPIRIRASNSAVLQGNCVRCHEGLVREICGATDTAGELNCVRCHSAVGHGPRR